MLQPKRKQELIDNLNLMIKNGADEQQIEDYRKLFVNKYTQTEVAVKKKENFTSNSETTPLVSEEQTQVGSSELNDNIIDNNDIPEWKKAGLKSIKETPQSLEQQRLEDVLSGKHAKEQKAKAELKQKKINEANEFVKSVTQKQKYPELTSEKDNLLKEISNRPIIQDNSDIENRIKEIDELMKPKSFRKIRKQDLQDVVTKMTDIENKDIKLGKNGELIATSGTYQELKKQRELIQNDIDVENKVIEKLSTDVSKAQEFFSVFSHDIETVELNDRTQENILLKIDENPLLKSQILKGGDNRHFLNIDKREAIIKEARLNSYLDSRKEVIEERDNLLLNYKQGKYKGTEKEIETKLQKLKDKYQTLSTIYKVDENKRKLYDVFKKTTEERNYEEKLKDNKLLDVASSLGEGVAHIGGATVTALPSLISSIADVFTDQSKYSVFDAYNDTLYDFSSYNILPSSQQAIGRVTGEGSKFSPYSIAKTVTQVAPLIMKIKLDAQKGNVRGIYQKFGKFINVKNTNEFARNLRVAETVYKATLTDNIKQAKDLGLTGFDVVAHSQATTLASSLVNMIVPDYKFFETSSGVILKKGFAKNLQSAVSNQSKKEVVKSFFKNIAGEVGEETLEGVIGELASIGLVDDYKSKLGKVDFYKDIMINTVVGTGGMGVLGLKSNYKATKDQAYKDIVDNFDGVYQQFELAKESLTDKTAIEIINKSQQHILDVKEAVDNAPEHIKSKHIDLLIEKKKLLKKIQNQDSAFNDDINIRIKEIDSELKNVNKNTKKPIKSDFDNTLYDNKTGELTELGQEIKTKIENGEDVTILTAREDTQENKQFIADKLGINPDKVKLGLTPQGKADNVNDGDIFYDDNSKNTEAVKNNTTAEVVEVDNNSNNAQNQEKQTISNIKPNSTIESETKEFADEFTDNGVYIAEDISDTINGGVLLIKNDTKTIIKSDEKGIVIESIESATEKSKGKGNAKKTLKELVDVANNQKKDISLKVIPKDSNTTEEGLVKLYESIGFVKSDDFDTSKEMQKPFNDKAKTTENKSVDDYISIDKVEIEYLKIRDNDNKYSELLKELSNANGNDTKIKEINKKLRKREAELKLINSNNIQKSGKTIVSRSEWNKINPKTQIEVVTNKAERQKIQNSIQEGEAILKSKKKISGETYTENELKAVQRSVDNAKAKLGIKDTKTNTVSENVDTKSVKEETEKSLSEKFKEIFGVEATEENYNKAKKGLIKPLKSSKPKFQKASITSVKKLVAKLRRAIKTKVILNKEKFDKRLSEITGKKLIDGNGKVYGFLDTKNGAIYLNPEFLNKNTPVHEFAHVYINSLKLKNRKLYNKGISLIKNSKYYEQVKHNKSYDNLSDKQKLDEALVVAIGDKGEQLLNDKKSAFVEFLSNLKDWLGNTFFKDKKSQIDKLTLNEFLDGSLYDLLGEKDLNIESKTNDNIQFQHESGFDFDEADKIFKFEQGRLSGIKHDVLPDDFKRENKKTTIEAEYEKGKKLVESGAIDSDWIVLYNKNQRNLNPEEVTAMVYYKAILDKKFLDLMTEIDNAKTKQIDKFLLAKLQEKKTLLLLDLEEYHKMSDVSGRFAGLSLRLRGAMADSNLNLAVEISKYKAKSETGTIPVEVEKRFEGYYKEYENLKKERDELHKKVEEFEKNKRKQTFAKKEVSFSKRERNVIDKYKTKSKQLFPVGFQFQIVEGNLENLSKEQTDLLMSFARDFRKGNKNFDYNNLNQAMKETFGNSVEKHTLNVFDTVTNPDAKKSKPKVDEEGKLTIPTSYLERLIVQGFDTHEKLNSKIASDLKSSGISVSEHDINVAVSRYGELRQLSEEPAKQKLRELKRDARLLSALKDVRDKKIPKKSGLKDIPSSVLDDENAWKSALEKIKSRLKLRIEDLELQIQNKKRTLKVKKTTKTDAEVEILRERVDELKATLDEELGKKELSYEDKVDITIKQLEKSINSLNLQIKHKTFPVKPIPITSPVIEGLRNDKKILTDKRNKLKEDLLSDTEKNKKLADRKLKQLNTRIDNIQRRLDRNELEFEKKHINTVSNNKIKQAKSIVEKLNNELYEARKNAGLIEKQKVKRVINYKLRQISILEEKLKNKDFSKKVNTPLPFNKEISKIDIELENIRDNFQFESYKQELADRHTARKIFDAFISSKDLMVIIMASGDFSAIARQGLYLGLSNPKEYKNAIKEAGLQAGSELETHYKDKWKRIGDLVALSKEGKKSKEAVVSAINILIKEQQETTRARLWENKIKSHELYPLMKRAGLHLSLQTLDARKREEEFASKGLSGLAYFKVSEALYVGFLNDIRASVFVKKAEKYIKQGYSVDTDIKLFKDLANEINIASGRGKLGTKYYDNETVSSLLFASKYVASRINIITTPFRLMKMHPAMRVEAMKQFLIFAGVQMSVLAILKNIGFDVETDCTNTDFGKIKVGDTRYDTLAGTQQVMKLLCVLLKGKKTTSTGNVTELNNGNPFNDTTYGGVLLRFGRSKLAPFPSLVVDASVGKTFIGEDFSLTKGVFDRLSPMYIGDVSKAKKKYGIPTASAIFLSNMIGISTLDYNNSKKKKNKGSNEIDFNNNIDFSNEIDFSNDINFNE